MARRGGGRDQNEITKNIKQGPVEVDYEESSLVVHYEIEMIEVDERGATIAILDRKPEMRRIKIKSLSPDRNMAQLAADIIDKCKYIHPSRTEEIEQLLIKLRKYHIANGHNLRDLSNSNNPEKAVVRDPHGQGVTNYANYQNQDLNVPMCEMIPTTNRNKGVQNHEEGMQVLIVRVVMTIAMIKEVGMTVTETAAPIITTITMPTTEKALVVMVIIIIPNLILIVYHLLT